MTWYPVSDHPTDKATYAFEITVPEGKAAVANGVQARPPTTEGGLTTWYWDAPDPQASYLGTASVGDFELSTSTAWFGNAVSRGRWSDIWLNEGWATYGSWMWLASRGGATLEDRFEEVMGHPRGRSLLGGGDRRPRTDGAVRRPRL